ncbi:MAG: ABC transporter ATP-binding protein [Actinomycetota bacterium]
MKNAPAYEVRNLTKVYARPEVLANDSLSFAVDRGESFGLLGANGAGKTTLVRQLVGLLVPTSGEVRLFGEPLRPGRDRRVGRTVAYLPQDALALGELKIEEAIRWTGMLRGYDSGLATSETNDLLDVLELGNVRDRQLRKLSGGQRRLVQIGMTLVGRLPVLILDEPTSDIDPALRGRIWELIAERAGAGAAVLLVTHDVAEAEHVLDRVAILDRGRVIALGTPAELKARLSHRTRIEVVLAEDSDMDPHEIGRAISEERKVRGRRISAWVQAEDAVAMLEKIVSSYGLDTLEDIHLVTPTLEDVYMELA